MLLLNKKDKEHFINFYTNHSVQETMREFKATHSLVTETAKKLGCFIEGKKSSESMLSRRFRKQQQEGMDIFSALKERDDRLYR
jgi:hypothetical protein